MPVRVVVDFLFVFKQKKAYEMRISDWSSDVCSSDLQPEGAGRRSPALLLAEHRFVCPKSRFGKSRKRDFRGGTGPLPHPATQSGYAVGGRMGERAGDAIRRKARSEEHTYELQSLMRISYAVFCLK